MEIHTYLTGRLGNQLFQYAFARSLQKKYGGKIYCNIYELEHRSEKMKHIPGRFYYDMGNYKLNDNVIIEDKKPVWYADFLNPVIRVVKKANPKQLFNIMVPKGYILWQRNEYIEMPEITTDKVFLNGWWQDFRFFHDVESELSDEITPITDPNPQNQYIYDLVQNKDSVCVSIRGGNYLTSKVKDSLFVCDKEYFRKAVRKMMDLLDAPVFIIFSDDLDWVRSYIKLESEFPNSKFYYESGTDTVEEKIRMMTMCKHFIISNSTFSWWAQYLARNKNKIVIAPDAWWTDGKQSGLYMDTWTLISADNQKG